MQPEIHVLRYGHRAVRDYRVTSHCCLVARAFGAKKIIIDGAQDKALQESVESVAKQWGNGFKIAFTDDWEKTLEEYKKAGFCSLHLTMYGLPLKKKIAEVRKNKKILLVIGSQKVSGRVYGMSDYNISITLQPHSEIAALAVALDWLQQGKELEKKFKNAKIRILPSAKGKRVERCGN